MISMSDIGQPGLNGYNYSNVADTVSTMNHSQELPNVVQTSPTHHPLVSSEVLTLVSVIVKCVLYDVISVFGIVTNVLSLLVFHRQGFKDTVNVSLTAMAISDICGLLALFWMGVCYNPLFADTNTVLDSRGTQYLTGGWPKFYFTRVSGLITAFVTFERCLCTAVPLKVKTILTPRRVVVIISAIFIAVALSISPVYFSTHLAWKWYPTRNASLIGLVFSENKDTINSITLGLSVVLCDGAFVFVALCTAILVINLNKSRKWKITAARGTDAAVAKETKASKMVVLIAVVFITCLLPGSVYSLAMIAAPDFNTGEAEQNLFFVAWSFAHVTESLNASVNFFVYLAMSSKFKDTFVSVFTGPRQREPMTGKNDPQTTNRPG
ncbi:adenosine receptor A1-like [Physella acuta]|uniref:adenosine receptor A1-like n=1 Tax=Physella acuta TaxID=109671 RepID=UPI0027DCCBDE|nr:adenosine receptor A1-like [Physella acuta]